MTSLAVGRDDLAAEAAIALVGNSAYLARYDDGESAGPGWRAPSLDRAGDGHELLRSWLLADEAIIEVQRHRSQEALDLITRALTLKEKVLPPDHPDIALGINNEANVHLAQMGRNDEALRTIERAYELFVKTFGPASVEAAFALNNRGEYLIALGRPAEALEPLQRSLATLVAQFGDDRFPLVGTPLTATGRALLALGRPAEALPPLERAARCPRAARGRSRSPSPRRASRWRGPCGPRTPTATAPARSRRRRARRTPRAWTTRPPPRSRPGSRRSTTRRSAGSDHASLTDLRS